MKSGTKIALGAAVIGGGAVGAYAISKAMAAPVGPPAAMCFLSSGGCTAHTTYSLGQTMQAQVTVPVSTTAPVSVQAFVAGKAGSVLPWSEAATGNTYTIDFGPANVVGVYSVYAKVTFANGAVSTTNSTQVTIVGAGATGEVTLVQEGAVQLQTVTLGITITGGLADFTPAMFVVNWLDSSGAVVASDSYPNPPPLLPGETSYGLTVHEPIIAFSKVEVVVSFVPTSTGSPLPVTSNVISIS